ncbi:MAG: GLPGLI family protein [Bacteroidota bacterium]
MKKIKTSILFIFIFFSAFSQTKLEIHYKVNTNFGLPIERLGVLKITENKSLFELQIKNPNSNVKLNEEGEYIEVVSFTKRGYTNSYFIDFEKQIFVLEENILGETYNVTRGLHNIDWIVMEETKKIGSFDCQLATGKFRGRIYNVWFTTKIPITSGPWKLYGLPGLILEATDRLNQVQFVMESIKTIDGPINLKPLKGGNEITFEEYVYKKENYKKDFSKKVDSKLPREVRVESVISTSKGLEVFDNTNN